MIDLKKYKGEPKRQPISGIFVRSRYNERSEEGSYELWDIATKTLIKSETYYSIEASDNLMGLAGITDAVCLCVSDNLEQEIYSANDVCVKWAKKCKGVQTRKDARAASLFKDCLSFLQKAEYNAFIKFWSPSWEHPKRLFK